METRRREFLRQISGVTALAASGSLLGRDTRAGSSQDVSSAEAQTIRYLESLRAQFPVLAERVNGNPLVYLDSAATTQRPRAVIDALSNFYLHENANPAMIVGPPELSRSYLTISKDLTRVMNRLKALYRGWGISCEGATVYAPHHRSEWLGKITEAGVRRRAEFFYQQLDALQALRQQVRRDLLAESRKHSERELLRQIPSIGPIRAALLMALIQTPHRFRTKGQLWAYSGLAIETHDSAQYRYVAGHRSAAYRAAP